MAFYAIATISLIVKLKEDVLQLWYADDAAGAGKLPSLRSWWDKINTLGPALGYYPNASKSHLLIKPHLLPEAQNVLQETNLPIINEGKEYLGGVVGSQQFTEESQVHQLTSTRMGSAYGSSLWDSLCSSTGCSVSLNPRIVKQMDICNVSYKCWWGSLAATRRGVKRKFPL